MRRLSFAKISPGGNPTLLLTDKDLDITELPRIAAVLMHPLHLQAEQAGALFLQGGVPHLQMMGGEFCVNATRAAAFILARGGRLKPMPSGGSENRDTGSAQDSHPSGRTRGASLPVWEGSIMVSGAAAPTRVLAASSKDALERALAALNGHTPHVTQAQTPSPEPAGHINPMFCAARVPCTPGDVRCEALQPGVHLVSLPGIRHLLVDAALHPLPDFKSPAWRTASDAWRRACGLDSSPASGVVWHERTPAGYRIFPAVEVAATASEHLETACGSASLAMAFRHVCMPDLNARDAETAPHSLGVLQPSGETLQVVFEGSHSSPADTGFQPEAAWVAGPVRLVAEGTAYV